MIKKIKLLLADDQKLFAESLQAVLKIRAEDIEIVGIAKNGYEAVELCGQTRPDIVLMDIRMPKLDGVESTKIIREKYPSIRVLILTTFDDDKYVVEALRLGAIGYLLKDMSPMELIHAVRTVHEGGVLISSQVAGKLVKKIAQTPEEKENSEEDPRPDWLDELSDKEKEILALLAQGYDNKEIAKRIYAAEQTVKNYVSIIYSKLGVKDRVQASLLAIRAGLDS